MKLNPQDEWMNVREIRTGLLEIEKRLHFETSVLQPFRESCDLYENAVGHPLAPMSVMFGTPKFREVVMFVTAGMDLVRYFRLANSKKQLKVLRDHLQLVGPGLFGVAATFTIQQANGSYLRNRLHQIGYPIPTAPIAADAARKTIELMVGMAAMSSFDSVSLEDPNASDPADPNPDVIIQHDGRRYGIACKSLVSSSESNFVERIDDGLSQLTRAIDGNKADRRCGMVLLDISAQLDHDRLYDGAGTVPSLRRIGPGEALLSEMSAALIKIFGPDRRWDEILPPVFAPYSLPPGILIYGHSLIICHDDQGAQFPVYQKAMIQGVGNDVGSIKPFCDRLNNAIHGQSASRRGHQARPRSM